MLSFTSIGQLFPVILFVEKDTFDDAGALDQV